MCSESFLCKELENIKKYNNIQYVLSANFVPGPVLRSPLLHLLTVILWEEIYHFPHFTDEEIEACRDHLVFSVLYP